MERDQRSRSRVTNLNETNKIVIDYHNDHRIAMSLSLLNSFMDEMSISDYKCIKSLGPNFWKDMGTLGMNLCM